MPVKEDANFPFSLDSCSQGLMLSATFYLLHVYFPTFILGFLLLLPSVSQLLMFEKPYFVLYHD